MANGVGVAWHACCVQCTDLRDLDGLTDDDPWHIMNSRRNTVAIAGILLPFAGFSKR